MVDNLKDRAKLRASEERRADHAFDVLDELIAKHLSPGGVVKERDLSDVFNLRHRLIQVIKNQHIKDEDYAQYKADRGIKESCPTEGDF